MNDAAKDLIADLLQVVETLVSESTEEQELLDALKARAKAYIDAD